MLNQMQVRLSATLKHAFLIIMSFVMFFPFLWMVTNSIKTRDEIWAFPPVWWPESPQWHHFIEAWNAAPFGLYIFNSAFTATVIVLIQLVNSAMMLTPLRNFVLKGKMSSLRSF